MAEENSQKNIAEDKKMSNTSNSAKNKADDEIKEKGNYFAAIRIRGGRHLGNDAVDTLSMLNLKNQHNLIIVKNTPPISGMLKKVKDYATWGEISEAQIKEIEAKKSAELKNNGTKIFRLNPPLGGFERKGIKKYYSTGGVLGYRGTAIFSLIKKMI